MEKIVELISALTTWFQKLVDACKEFANGWKKEIDFPNMPDVVAGE